MNNIFLKNVFLKDLMDSRMTAIWWSLAIIIFNLMVMGFYPSFANNTYYSHLLQTLPPALSKVFLGNIDGISGPLTYLDGKLFALVLPFVFLFFNMFNSSEAIALEEKNGSLDLLLSTPIQRWKLLLEKFAAMIIMNLILGIFSYLSIIAGGILVNASLNPWHIWDVSLSLIGLGIFFGSLAVSLSAITGNRQISLGITGAVGIGTYMLNALAPLSTNLVNYQKLSPFYYYSNNVPIVNGIDWGNFSVLIMVSLIFLILGMMVFQKRDITSI